MAPSMRPKFGLKPTKQVKRPGRQAKRLRQERANEREARKANNG